MLIVNLVIGQLWKKHFEKAGNKKRQTYCYCRCACGTEKWVRKSSLSKGESKSCGCLAPALISEKAKKRIGPRLKLGGKQFGYLVVTEEWKREKSGKSYVTKWKCKCKCGQEKWIQASSLSQKQTRSCGCFQREMTSIARKLEPGMAAKRAIYRQYKLRSRRKNLDFSISFLEFLKLTARECYYCGRLLSNKYAVERNNGVFCYNGLDRKNNKLGYSIDNAVSCCKYCNVAKSTMSETEFFKWIIQVYNYYIKTQSIKGLKEAKYDM